MNRQERLTAGSLAAVYAVRMLGLFMILPVFAIYAESIPDSSDLLIGIALGIYGLTQAIFQIPLGLLSDKIGRKPVIVGGLLIFSVGSVVAALASTIEWIIIGRAIQGMGAVAAATMALSADLTREENRAKVMSVIGLTIGIAFSTAMILGPVINQWAGVPGIFWVTACLAIAGILLVIFVVPQLERHASHRDTGVITGYLNVVLTNTSLLRMNIGIFILHMIMMANFLVLPTVFEDVLLLPLAEHWQVYLPVFILAFALAVPFIIIAEKYQKMKGLILLAVIALGISEVGMGLYQASYWGLLAVFLLFFIGFNFLEAVQPSLVAKYSSVDTKGTAMGVFTSSQFFGIFVGGIIGGYLKEQWGIASVFYFGAVMSLLWFFVVLTLPKPKFYLNRLLKLRTELLDDIPEISYKLQKISGVKEVSVIQETGVAYLKIDKKNLNEDALKEFSA